MNPRIKILDQHSINQIAAGEVVERPLSVVKELIENSLDASARKINISVEGRGTSFIKIKDDGSGIHSSDLPLAIQPHATSKIDSISDLETLKTLGFRGEALASIVSVSRLTILSRPAEELSGYEIRTEAGSVLEIKEVGCPPGTTVTVRDLFFNTPARLKFLRSNNTEFGLISDMVSRLALARPDVAFTLRHPDKVVFNTPGTGNLLETIAIVFGHETARKLLPVNYEDDSLQIRGFISPPSLVRSSLNNVIFIVNSRVIRSQQLNQALKDGYYTLIPTGTYPLAVLSLTMSPSDYDVNVHPAKLEIKFKDEKKLKEKITAIVRKSLLTPKSIQIVSFGKQGYTGSSGKEQRKGLNTPALNDNLFLLYGCEKPKKEDSIEYQPLKSQEPINLSKNLGTVNNIAEANYPLSSETFSAPLEINNREINPDSIQHSPTFRFEELRALNQIFNTYILATDEKSLFIIDQHAAHERIRYDQLSKKLKENKPTSQTLLIPETIDLTPQEESILLEYFDELHEMGFIIEHFGEKTYFLRGVPFWPDLHNPGTIFRLFLDEILSGSYRPTTEKLFERWIFVLACRTATKAQERLTLQEMDVLIQQLGATLNPYTCPHGRPTIIEIPKKELEKRFYR
ncbi:MAG TPA: DNA mismatch repair endonuclease MutL [Peptococcaceae bacterium]|nr:DNA mismatch repair endonuclease MutL [Peptococcaceae bacterium]